MKWLSHPVAVCIFSLVACIFAISLRQRIHSSAGSGQQVAQLRAEVERLEAQSDSLLHQLETANTPLAQEKMIRNQLLMKKEGEYVVQLVDDPRKKTQKNEAESIPSPLEAWKALLL